MTGRSNAGGGGGGGGGLRDFFCHRPPSAVFLMCLLSFGLTTMSLSFYFSQSEGIANPDALNWNTFLSETGRLHFCLDKNALGPSNGTEAPSKSRSVSIKVSLEGDWYDDYLAPFKEHVGDRDVVVTRGRIRLRDMGRSIPHRFQKEEATVTLAIPLVESSEATNMCLNVEASDHVLEVMNSAPSLPENCTLPSDYSDEKTVNLTSVSGDHVPHSWCENGVVFRMPFETQPAWTVLIGAEDQTAIHLHLMVMSAFLFAIVGIKIIGVFIGGIFCHRKSSNQRKEVPDYENFVSDSDNY